MPLSGINSKSEDSSHQTGNNALLSLGQDHSLSYQQLESTDVNQFGQSSLNQSSNNQIPNQYQQQYHYQQSNQQQNNGQQPQPLYFQTHPSQQNQSSQYSQSIPHDFNYMQVNGTNNGSGSTGNSTGTSTGTSNANTNTTSNNPNFNQQQFSELMYNSFLSQLSQKQQPQQSQSVNQQQLNLNNSLNPATAAAAANNPGFMNPSLQRYYQNNLAGYPSMTDNSNQSLLQPSHQIQSQSSNQQQLHQQLPQQQASVQYQQQQAIQQAQLQAQAQAQLQAQAHLQAQQQLQAQHQQTQSHAQHGRKNAKGHRGNANQGHLKNGKGGNGVKKLSTTQSRIEKRKQLKKQGPKRPSSAYFLFSMSIRNELLQQYPDAKVPELSKLASAKWKELTDDEKKPFYDEFRVNWEKYRVLRDEYEKTLPPKRPSGPFIQFTQEIRPLVVKENPDKNLIEITKLIGERWRNLNPVEKTKYTDAYKQKLKEWEKFYPTENATKDEQTKLVNNPLQNNDNTTTNELNLNLTGSPSNHNVLNAANVAQTINPASTDVNAITSGIMKAD